METFLKYPELVTLDKRPEILAVKQVVATEKLHGSNFRVLFPAGMASLDEVRFGGRNEVFAPGDDGFYGGKAVRWWKSRAALMQRLWEVFAAYGFGSDVVVYGEICGAGIQKGVRYAASDDALFRAFDIRVGDCFVTYDLFTKLCDDAGLPRVPEIWRGEPTLAAFDALLEKPSEEGLRNGVAAEGNLAEGVVIRSNPLLRDVFGSWLIIKHKSAGFAEVAKRAPKTGAKPEGRADVDAFTAAFVTRGRILNAVGRLRDAGAKLAGGMEDMPVLAPAVVADLHKEEEPAWQALLAGGAEEKQIRGAVTKAVAAVYRRVLLEGVG
jgi:Rnl2 family RNA ligase